MYSLRALRGFSEDSAVHGILVLRPPGADRRRGGGFGGKSPQRYRLYEPGKSQENFYGRYFPAVAPCTPEAVIETLKFYGYEIRGKM